MVTKASYCISCVAPAHAVNMTLDEHGVCSACRVAEQFELLSDEHWEKRKKRFERLVDSIKSDNEGDYDCLIPVSGGKDSYYQIHKMAIEYGLKPLLVTYHGNNYLPEGDYNRDKMRHVFDADHLIVGPSVEVLKKMNRLAFRKMGDMNWHAHCGIFTVPIQVAVRYKIPLIIWGETAWDISGMYDPDDFVEFSAQMRHDNALRGYEWYDFIGDSQDPLTSKDLNWAKYPSDKEIVEVGVRGLYIGNFFKWDPNAHTKLVMERYGWREKEEPFERTYRKMSNLDDRYENGIHDLLKFVKFGYGRATDHASKDIRSGYMTREEGIEMVKKYDHIVSSDLDYWLEYVEMTVEEFWEIADSFRDPRVWWIENGHWHKHNIWGESCSYGEVHLPKSKWSKYQKEELQS
ncbi:MAG: N-acetyl sugar amidotransferase [Pseudomonadota bacterium]